jgi:hypothetical protein
MTAVVSARMVALATGLLFVCSTVVANPYYNPGKAHHADRLKQPH